MSSCVRRPNLLGLDVDKNLRKIVDYLVYVETPPETIVKWVLGRPRGGRGASGGTRWSVRW